MIYDMTRDSNNMNKFMRGDVISHLDLEGERDCSLNSNYLTDADLA